MFIGFNQLYNVNNKAQRKHQILCNEKISSEIQTSDNLYITMWMWFGASL